MGGLLIGLASYFYLQEEEEPPSAEPISKQEEVPAPQEKVILKELSIRDIMSIINDRYDKMSVSSKISGKTKYTLLRRWTDSSWGPNTHRIYQVLIDSKELQSILAAMRQEISQGTLPQKIYVSSRVKTMLDDSILLNSFEALTLGRTIIYFNDTNELSPIIKEKGFILD